MDELGVPAVLARIGQLYGLTSQPKLARYLGVTEKTLSNWMHARTLPDEQKALQLAELAGINSAAFAAFIQAQRSGTPEGRRMWEAAARRLQQGANSAASDATDSGAPDADQHWLGGA